VKHPDSNSNSIKILLKRSGLIVDGDDLKINPIFGGSINSAFSALSSEGNFFIKENSISRIGVFISEKYGLEFLALKYPKNIPNIHLVTSLNNKCFIISDYIIQGEKNKSFYTDLGELIANLHGNKAEHFGLDHDNYLGLVPQINENQYSIHDFIRQNRFYPLAETAKEIGLITHSEFKDIYSIGERLEELIPKEKPSLIHGDLWKGNIIADQNGIPFLIDPCINFSHREFDIAFSRLFGSFDAEFYSIYNEINPLEKDWELRTDLFNIYPLLAHLLIFGKSYKQQLLDKIEKFK
jgi:protein-ribulosamine 3-kinase